MMMSSPPPPLIVWPVEAPLQSMMSAFWVPVIVPPTCVTHGLKMQPAPPALRVPELSITEGFGAFKESEQPPKRLADTSAPVTSAAEIPGMRMGAPLCEDVFRPKVRASPTNRHYKQGGSHSCWKTLPRVAAKGMIERHTSRFPGSRHRIVTHRAPPSSYCQLNPADRAQVGIGPAIRRSKK